MLRLFILLILMVILPDSYLWWTYVAGWPVAGQACFLAMTFVVVMGLIMLPIDWFPHNFSVRMLFGSMLCLVLPKIVFILADLLLPWPWALAMAGLVLLCVGYGFVFGWFRLTVRQETFAFTDLPRAFDGYRILHFSDLHAGTFSRKPQFVRHLADTIQKQQADMIVFTGDLINLQTDELLPFMADLSRLQAPDGVYSVLGNHDFTKADPEGIRLAKAEQLMGWQVLNDRHVVLSRGKENIALIGVQNIGDGVFKTHGDLQKAIGRLPADGFTILLTHTPTHWRSEVVPATGIQLTLAGHTHGGQMRLGPISPARYIYRYWAGSYRSADHRWLYVSQGLGGTLPFRFMAWPEVTVITLRHADQP